jgi:predicted negative regulator of RcsB-dependent stress response
MIGYETEEQQVQAIKQFWKDNGIAIIAGALIGLGGLASWNWYNDYTISTKEEASVGFQTSLEAFVESESLDDLNAFVDNNASTGYAPLAAMIVAQEAVKKEDFEAAKVAIQKATTGDSTVADVARLRLADLHLQLGEYDQALTALASVKAASFTDQVEELKGDALLAKGDFEGARAAYQASFNEVPGNPNIKMKLDNIAFAKTQSMQVSTGNDSE